MKGKERKHMKTYVIDSITYVIDSITIVINLISIKNRVTRMQNYNEVL